MPGLILVRYGEIGLKGKNRPLFEQRLAANIKECLAEFPGVKVRRIFGRLLVEVDREALEEALARLGKVFGLVSASAVRQAALDEGAIRKAVLEEVEDGLRRRTAATFRIHSRRSNKGFPLDSQEMNRRFGAAVLEAYPHLKVNLEDADLTVYVEVRDRAAYVYSDGVPGPGGLPVGVSSRGLVLLSGGIDSPVAAWMAASRGIAVEAVHFHSFPFTSAGAQQKVLDLCRVLSTWIGHLHLHMVRFTEVQTEIRRTVPVELGVTVMRRFMMRIAQALALQRGVPVLITGESVGQVASQTVESIAVINRGVDLPVLRPLVALPKEEIVARARHIGTYEISVRPYEDCCTLFLPEHPETRPSLERVEKAEAPLNVDELVQGAVQQVEHYRWVWGREMETAVPAETGGGGDAL